MAKNNTNLNKFRSPILAETEIDSLPLYASLTGMGWQCCTDIDHSIEEVHACTAKIRR